MYALAFSMLKRNIALFTIVLVVVVMLESIMSAMGVVTLIFSGITMLYTHRMIQLDEVYGWADPLSTTGKDGSKVPILSYLLRFVALFLALMLFMAGAFMLLEATAVVDPNALASDLTYAMWGLLLGAPAFACALALIGTVLPACAERADTSLGAAFRRGKTNFLRTFVHILIGPLVVICLGSLALGQIGWILGPSDGYIVKGLYQIAATVLAIIPALLAATALSMAYLTAESRD